LYYPYPYPLPLSLRTTTPFQPLQLRKVPPLGDVGLAELLLHPARPLALEEAPAGADAAGAAGALVEALGHGRRDLVVEVDGATAAVVVAAALDVEGLRRPAPGGGRDVDVVVVLRALDGARHRDAGEARGGRGRNSD